MTNLVKYFSIMFSITLIAAEPSPYLKKYCYDCHADGSDKGGIDFDQLNKNKNDLKHWQKVWDVIEKEQMPPSNKKRPSDEQRDSMLKSIAQNIFNIDLHKESPQKILLYRLSNEQLSRSLQYIFGYTVKGLSENLPSEPTTFGFSNIGSNMNISSIHFESYQELALQVSHFILPENRKEYLGSIGLKWLKLLAKKKPDSLKKLVHQRLL